ncbi:MAG: hypothetical protein N3B16_04700 [Candidatus Aminicenantes bacterium]|nr:hypothetical protein [Candidatus Aminicenantes bacterium]
MKKLIFLLIGLLAGYCAFQWYMQTNTPQLIMVRTLQKEFNRAVDNYITALRQVAEPGLVVISDPEKAEGKIKEVRAKLQEIIVTLTEVKAIEKAKKLEQDIKVFCEKHQIN